MIPTRDHKQIRAWAARHGAVPAEADRMVHDGQPTILHFLFGDAAITGTPDLKPISWEQFFAHFDVLDLSMAWHDDTGFFEIVRVEKPQPAAPAN